MKPTRPEERKPGSPNTSARPTDARASAETRVEGALPTRTASEPAAPVVSARIEHEGVIARGGMGTVHRVYDKAIRRHSAMKVLDDALALNPQARRRFLAEAQIAGQLDHPNIVPVYDLEVTDDGTPRQFTMKLVEGMTLAAMLAPERVAERGDSELWDLLHAFVRVCDAVAFAHSRGVVHRDLKPDNIMLGDYGQVYVMDWGIARVDPTVRPGAVSLDDEAPLDESGTILGTAQYMAPEQAWAHNESIDARTDIFALGGILYQILTGHPPYQTGSREETLQLARLAVIPPPEEVAPGVPLSPSLSRIAMKALSSEPDERYASVNAMKRDVEGALRGGLWLGSRTFAAGTEILREGDAPDAAYIITSGKALAFKTLDGARQPLREMQAGEVFGEMALLADRPRTASVAAIDDVTCIVVTREALARELHAESWLAALVNTLVVRLCDLDEQLRSGSR